MDIDGLIGYAHVARVEGDTQDPFFARPYGAFGALDGDASTGGCCAGDYEWGVALVGEMEVVADLLATLSEGTEVVIEPLEEYACPLDIIVVSLCDIGSGGCEYEYYQPPYKTISPDSLHRFFRGGDGAIVRPC